jgi:hypothetical protein
MDETLTLVAAKKKRLDRLGPLSPKALANLETTTIHSTRTAA